MNSLLFAKRQDPEPHTMKKVIIIAFYLATVLGSEGQTISYNLATIPDSIKKNAGVIMQYENKVFTLQDIDEAFLYVRRVYTVANEYGKDALDFYVSTSKFINLLDADLKVYDAMGKLISKHKKKEMMTQAMGEGLVDDGYVTYYSVNTSSFPVREYHMRGTSKCL